MIWDAVNSFVTWKSVNKDSAHYEYNNERDYIYRTQLKVFIDCIENNNVPMVTVEDGACVMKLIDAARTASISGSKVDL